MNIIQHDSQHLVGWRDLYVKNQHQADIPIEQRTTLIFSPAEPSEADMKRISAMSSQSSPSESYRSEYLGLTEEDARELGTINSR